MSLEQRLGKLEADDRDYGQDSADPRVQRAWDLVRSGAPMRASLADGERERFDAIVWTVVDRWHARFPRCTTNELAVKIAEAGDPWALATPQERADAEALFA